jgi:hypothetical protein
VQVKEERKAEGLPAHERTIAEADYGQPRPRSDPRASGHGLKVAHTSSEVREARSTIFLSSGALVEENGPSVCPGLRVFLVE